MEHEAPLADETPEDARASDVPPPKRPFAALRFWLPPLVLATLLGGVSLLLAGLSGEFGWAALAVPIAIAAATSYRVPGSRGIGLALAFGAGLVGFWLSVAMAVQVGPMGPICGAIFGVLGTVPALLGAALGVALRKFVVARHWVDWKWFFPLLLAALALGGPGAWLEARLTPRNEPIDVRATAVVQGAPDDVWRTQVFGGDEAAEEPWLAHAGLPTPAGASGRSTAVGDVKLVPLGDGHMRLRVVVADAPRLLRYEVVEQHRFEDGTARLLGGSLRLDDAGDGTTRVTISTRYEPLLGARAVWAPTERFVANALHRQLLREIQRAHDAGEIHAPESHDGP